MPCPKIIKFPIKNEEHVFYDTVLNKWIATIRLKSTIMTLGHYLTRALAIDVYNDACNYFKGKKVTTKCKTKHEYEIDELKIDLDSLISSFNATRTRKINDFSVHEWTRQLIRYKDHMEFSKQNGINKNVIKQVHPGNKSTEIQTDVRVSRSKRKQCLPKRNCLIVS